MQDLLFQLLWGNTDIGRKAHALALAAPGYEAAFQTYQAAHQSSRPWWALTRWTTTTSLFHACTATRTTPTTP